MFFSLYACFFVQCACIFLQHTCINSAAIMYSLGSIHIIVMGVMHVFTLQLSCLWCLLSKIHVLFHAPWTCVSVAIGTYFRCNLYIWYSNLLYTSISLAASMYFHC